MPAMPEIALLTAANLVSDAPDRRADAHLFDIQLDILRGGLAPHGFTLTPVRWIDPVGLEAVRRRAGQLRLGLSGPSRGFPRHARPHRRPRRSRLQRSRHRPLEHPQDLPRASSKPTGVPVIPTLWPEAPTGADIRRRACDAFGASDVILKRQVGGGARAQVRYTRANLASARPVMDRPGMIQPFIPAIATEGEYSFLFVDGEFSHALVKRPKSGDYRIQEAYGGNSQAIDPTPADRAAAQRVLDALDMPPLYARVDMVRGRRGRPSPDGTRSHRALPVPEGRPADRPHARRRPRAEAGLGVQIRRESEKSFASSFRRLARKNCRTTPLQK